MTRIYFIATILIHLFISPLFSQGKDHRIPKNLKYREDLPVSNDITGIRITASSLSGTSVMDADNFLASLDIKPKPIKPNDAMLEAWNYSPWCKIKLSTDKGDYLVELFLGGLGFVTFPDGDVAAVLFDLRSSQ